ncbi:MAG: hypothetical protein KF802_02205 [Bdellovibrionaceae bacterium]|nr:hypothetical protein [Pseudobdellovibrionaceae bacterium]
MSKMNCNYCGKAFDLTIGQMAIPLGPVCRANTIAQGFGIMKNFTEEEAEKKIAVFVESKPEDLAQEYLESTCTDPVDFYTRVNELRKNLQVGNLISPDFKQLQLLELEQIKNQGKKSRPGMEKLLRLGFTADEIRYAKDFDSLLKKYLLRNPGKQFDVSKEEVVETYYQALDYLDRFDRQMLLQIELNPSEKNRKMAEKREREYQLMSSCGFTLEDITNHKDLIQRLETDPKVQQKAYRMLMAIGKKKTPPQDDNALVKAIQDDIRFFKATFKSAMWFSVLAIDIASKVGEVSGFKTSKRRLFKRSRYKTPAKLFKEWKNYSEGKSKQAPTQEYIQKENAKDFELPDVDKFFKNIKKTA